MRAALGPGSTHLVCVAEEEALLPRVHEQDDDDRMARVYNSRPVWGPQGLAQGGTELRTGAVPGPSWLLGGQLHLPLQPRERGWQAWHTHLGTQPPRNKRKHPAHTTHTSHRLQMSKEQLEHASRHAYTHAQTPVL